MTIQARIVISRHNGFALDASLSMPSNGFTGIYGHSAAGKTTLLRGLAGLERADNGTSIKFRGETWHDEGQVMPTERRGIGFVFQDARLLPHLSVKGNLDYAIKHSQRWHAASSVPEIDEVISWMELDQLMHLSVEELSGGQAQRVAIARALLSSHNLLLMDEPVSALDPRARARVLNCLQRVHRDLKTPVIYVSHNLEEITNLSDRIAIMAEGRILEQGSTMDMCSRPELTMAQEEHAAAILSARVVNHDDDYMLTEVSTGAGRLYLALGEHKVGDTVRIRIPARDVSVVLQRPENTSILNVLHSKIEHLRDNGDGRVLLRLAHDKQHFLARLTRKSVENLGLAEGLMVYAQIKSVALLTESVIQVSEPTDDR